MRPYFHLLRQEPPEVSHKTPQKVLILVLGECYSNCYIVPELANKYNWWQVVSVTVLLNEDQKSMVNQALMYMQHRHIVCGEFHICHDLDLYPNLYYNDYATLLLHEAMDVNHIMVMLGISWYHNTFSHLCVQHQNYPEYDTLCLYIFFYWLFSCLLSDQWLHVYDHH